MKASYPGFEKHLQANRLYLRTFDLFSEFDLEKSDPERKLPD